MNASNPHSISRIVVASCLALLIGLSGCATTQQTAKRQPTMITHAPTADMPAVVTETQPKAAIQSDEVAEDESRLVSIKPGTGSFLNEKAARAYPPITGASGEVTFNFEGESLYAVIKAILGDVLQQNYVVAPGVQGTVTFSTAKPVRAEQSLAILEMLLRWNNATLVWQDGRYTVLPIAQAIPGNLTPKLGDNKAARGYGVRAFPLSYISVAEMEKLLKPYAKPEAIVSVDPARNLLMLAGTPEELRNYAQTIQVFDVDWLAGMSVGVFSLKQSSAEDIVKELETVFGESAKTPLAGMFRFMPLQGVNSILVITPQQSYLQKIEDWIRQFDMGTGQAGQRLYVYDVENSKAKDLAQVLQSVFGGGGGQQNNYSEDVVGPGLEAVTVRSFGQGGLNDAPVESQGSLKQGSGNNKPMIASNQKGGGNLGLDAGGALVDAAGGISIGAADDVRISAVEENNSLIVLATASQWESIRQVIERLDKIPLQVQIETQIVEVSLTDTLKYGVRWFLEGNISDEALRTNASNRRDWSSIGASIATGGADGSGSTTWNLIGPNAYAVLETLDEVSEATVISAPAIVVMNNKKAKINVGNQIPVSTSSAGQQLNTQVNNFYPTNYYQYRQTGVTLDVTPRVNPGGLVFMEVAQESSAPGKAGVGGNPAVSTRNITTEIAVKSGQTVMLGGLISQEDSDGSKGLPFLSRIPVIGGLFGQQAVNYNRTELLVLITPRVISSPLEAQNVTEEYKRRFRALKPLNEKAQKELGYE